MVTMNHETFFHSRTFHLDFTCTNRKMCHKPPTSDNWRIFGNSPIAWINISIAITKNVNFTFTEEMSSNINP